MFVNRGFEVVKNLKQTFLNFSSNSELVLGLERMSRENFFKNPYQDYTSEGANRIIDDGNPKNTSIISAKLGDRWNDTIGKLSNLDHKDYTVYTGTSGIALLKLKYDSNCRQNLEEAKNLLNLTQLNKKRCTFLCGDAGPLAIAAVIDSKLGFSFQQHVDRLKAMEEPILEVGSELPNEYMYGRIGYLYALLFINKEIKPAPIDDAFIRKSIETILIIGKNESKAGNFKCPLFYQWHDSYYLGAAHGVAGILYLLLQASDYLTEHEMQGVIKPTVDYLATLQFPSGNFPSSVGRDNDKYVQWCHGAPGFTYLFSAAYRVYGDSKYLRLALECGDVVWGRGLLKKGYSLCHGVAGNAYCFLELYQTTQDEKHLYRAIKFAEWCVDYTRDHEQHPPDRPQSLFEGVAGPMYLLLDIQNAKNAKFPGFTL